MNSRDQIKNIIGYTCETSSPNGVAVNNYILDRWMQPRLDALEKLVEDAGRDGWLEAANWLEEYGGITGFQLAQEMKTRFKEKP